MRIFMDCIYLLGLVAISPVALYRIARHKRYRIGWAQRLGKISRKHPDKKCIWLHAVSVGEVNATRTLVEALEEKFSEYEILISTTTDTGFARAKKLFATSHTVCFFPFDLSCIMLHAFRNIRPAVCLLMELEVWPNFVRTAELLNVPVIIVNGRISDRSFSKYKKIKPVAKSIFKKVRLILAQTEQYAQRFREIGCPEENVIITGSLKYDTAQITDKVQGSDVLVEKLSIKGQKLWVAGATGDNEEQIILEVYHQLKQQKQFEDLRLAIVPRKPERFDEVAQLIKQRNLPLLRYSRVEENSLAAEIDKQAVILGDTMGDLRKFYSLADVIFVGRSLVPMGGSDMAEAAALGKCTIFGPYAFNFKQTVDVLLEGHGAIMVKDKDDLAQTMQKCLADRQFAKTIANNGREIIRKNQGATTKTIDQIAKFLNPA
ncbi:MAG: 3-deoxy-D-manno-octulosonic acid transferase [Sedimentisphaerales bacterium]|nr:3-deoxy-D-manno-octulosonic acid transferase [Sedimentisphaerales bacterium]